MFLTKRKLNSQLNEISEYRYRDRIHIPFFNSMIDEQGEIAAEPPVDGEWSELRVGDTWKGRDLYLWLTTNIDVPATWAGRRVLGRFDFGETGAGNNSGFESLFFFNGKPYQGVDSNHTEVFLPNETVGTQLPLTFRLWSGLEGGGPKTDQTHGIRMAEICWLDEATDDFYFTALAVVETLNVLDAKTPEYTQLMSTVDRSFLLIDWSRPGSDNFYASIGEARNYLRDEINKMEKSSPVTVTCIGHTHIDVAWLWQLKHTREKCARSFSTVLRLMEMFPDYTFLQTQPQLYEYIKNDYPEIYENIRERVAEGRWEAGGGMWLEADCNLTSGESLVRQLLYGTRFLRNEFGVECDYLWLPDVFGYSWSLPQILKKSGINTFMTTKISWNQYNRMPHDTFQWRGIDGTEVLTHFITTPEPWSEEDSWFYTYNGRIIPKTVKGIWDTYRDKEVNRNLLLSYGYGDGGGGVNREMLEMRRRLNDLPGLPKIETGTAGDYFRTLQETVANTDRYVHVWDGELYLEYHRGTYTSQAYNKRMNRKLELLYREAEWLNTLQSVMTGDWSNYRQTDLDEGWRIILRNQFHDIIPGSSIREVYEDSTIEYAQAEAIGQSVWEQSSKALVSGNEAGKYTIWNNAAWELTELVEITVEAGMETGHWISSEGKQLQAQREGDRWIVEVSNIPSLGYTTISFVEDVNSESLSAPFKLNESGISTPHFDIEWNEQGQLVSIYDINEQRQVLANGSHGNVFQVFEDKPLAHEAWDIDIYYQQKKREVTDCRSIEVIEKGSLRCVVQFTWSYMDSTIKQQMILHAHHRRIDFVTKVDWHERQQLMKVAFPVAIRATEATYDIQFGNVTRPTHWNTSWDYARFETVGHQWADLSDRGYGVSLLNDCKYGYDIKDNVMRLSLIKSATHPDPEADQGEHTFTYSILPHTGDWLQGDTVRQAWSVNNPLRSTMGQAEVATKSLIRLSTQTVMVSAIKKSEDGQKLIVRVHDYSGSRQQIDMTSDLNIISWQECNLMERPEGEVHTEPVITFILEPYELKTFEIEAEKLIK
ncbi:MULTISPECIES: alpha-mannosidase [Paenibacillus]|uniref:alpha-mannosidase n=1 Tax=Paenibacillus TaxID=44249 RepID=UPI002DBD5388|nr:alpha-mannosidase [Paenibacillus odorifer]MEC0130863.1 alpha-mannosidase [Paenibacillus odorifer]MEC0221067.1 alpha-mannosidase [Paenibacillus odorifer]